MGVDYFEANGGYLSMPMSAQNKVSYAELLAVSKIASSTKFSGGLSYGDFNMQANPSANENGGISDSAQTQEEKE